MKIVLQNYFADKVEFEVNTDNIRFARYNIISGDEVLTVYYLDKDREVFDSDKHGRHLHYDEYEVLLYSFDELKLINKLPIIPEDEVCFKRADELEKLLSNYRNEHLLYQPLPEGGVK